MIRCLGLAAIALISIGCRHAATAAAGNQSSTIKLLRMYPLDKIPTAVIEANGHKIPVWLMTDDGMRQEGFMDLHDEDIPSGHGMLFVFPDSQLRSFWMKDTYVKLAICYIGADKSIVSISHGQPFDQSPLPSTDVAQYVLEVKESDFPSLGLKGRVGDQKGTQFSWPDTVKTDK